VEYLAHKILNRTYIPTKDERFQVLKGLDDDVRHLYKTYVRRKGNSVLTEQPAPDGYSSYRDYQLMWFVDRIFVPKCCAEYLEILRGLIRRREELRSYAARRSGRPENRYQNPSEWDTWFKGNSLASVCGFDRETARKYLHAEKGYEITLWEVANQWMMGNGQLDRPQAAAIKKSVDRAYLDVFGVKAPKVPRGWWHPEKGLGITPGGLQEIGLAWNPPAKPSIQSRETPIPYHIRIEWTRVFSCWKDDPDRWS